MRYFLFAVMITWLLSSCVASRAPIQYLEQNFDTAAYRNVGWQELRYKPGDLLSIKVYSDNASAAAVYNEGGGFVNPVGNSAQNTRNQGVADQGYLVNADGKINMMGVGSIVVVGKTGREVAAYLVDYFKVNNLLNNPAVDVKLMNFRVTISGEVSRPGVYPIVADKINVLEALAMSGDFTKYAKREIVTIMRERDGKRTFTRLNVNDASIFQSPFFHLEQNDVIMVPATKMKDRDADQLTIRNISLSLNFLSLLTILAVNFF